MIARMDYERLKRYSLAEIALLALFVLGLAIAQIIVKVRHRVILSEPISLVGSGLSVSMPVNPGWEYEKKWRHESDNSIALVGQLQTGQSRGVSVQWRYYFGSPGESAQEILQRRAHQSGSSISNIETISGSVPMEYGIVSPADGSGDPFYLGIVRLDFGRHLELQVYTHQVDLYYAEDILLALADSFQYELPQQLQHGKDLTGTFWKDITHSLLFRKQSDETFLIKSINSQPIGYRHDQYSTHTAGGKTQLQISSRQYEHNVSLLDLTFWLSGGEKRFTWETTFQRAGVNDPRIYTVTNKSDGVVEISTNFNEDRQFASDSLLLPELFLPECASLLLNTQQNNVIVDVLSPDGVIVPTVIEKINIDSALARSEEIAFAIKIDPLNNPNSFEELYFDANRKLIGRFEQQGPRQRLWDITTAKELERIFGDNFKSANETVTQIETPRRSLCMACAIAFL